MVRMFTLVFVVVVSNGLLWHSAESSCSVDCGSMTCADQIMQQFTCSEVNCPQLTLSDIKCGDVNVDLKCPDLKIPRYSCPSNNCNQIIPPSYKCPGLSCTDADCGTCFSETTEIVIMLSVVGSLCSVLIFGYKVVKLVIGLKIRSLPSAGQTDRQTQSEGHTSGTVQHSSVKQHSSNLQIANSQERRTHLILTR